ncbi:hypothetical protein C8Q73DRAFT_519319 [Cubamyces lactineus]|nr:hypothetical protein C8Q73DRAFT_519319 [Cubamyces lactineus]
MGRRKIEIQPITHERNRSVTFLKRKNGLFKKAYELGVLCSVDVAVIIFEERPGHHAKLYQYCSTDVNAMVQRHLRFDGERDTKGPADFSNNNNKQVDDAADDDDDGDDDDSAQKRRDGNKPTKVKAEGTTPNIVPIRPGPPSTDVSTSPELDYRSSMRVSPTASTSSLPISGERHTSAITSATRGVPISNTAKRPRLSDDASHAIQSAAATVGANSNHISSPTFPYRIDIDLPPYSLSQLHSHHPSLTALYSGGNPMANLMNGSPSSFLSQSPFDLSRGNSAAAAAAALRGVTFPPTGPSHYSPHGQQQSPSLFSRPQSSPQGGGGGGGPHSHGNSHAHASASTLFADLLGAAGEHGNGAGHPGAAAAQFPTFDWPVHASAPSQQGAQGQHENAAQNSPTVDSSNWFDFLSTPTTTSNGTSVSAVAAAAAAAGLSLPPPVPPLNNTRYAPSPGMGRKRLRDEGTSVSDSGESDEQTRRERPGVNGNGGERNG